MVSQIRPSRWSTITTLNNKNPIFEKKNLRRSLCLTLEVEEVHARSFQVR